MKKLYLIILLSITLLLAGCSSSNNNSSNGGTGAFKGGNDALTIEFAEGTPPDSIRDQGLEPFSVMVDVKNEGEFDIPENSAFVALSGIGSEALGINDTSKAVPQLNGYRKDGDNVLEGRTQRVIFSNLRYYEDVRSGSIPVTLYATVCYPYETRALTLVCINGDTNPSLDEKTQICDLNSDRESSNSGGPIQIENVKQYAFGSNSIQISFDVVHTPVSTVANVYERGSIDQDCKINGERLGSAQARLAKDKVKYTVDTGLSGLNCGDTGSNSEVVYLTNDRYKVTCVQDTTGQEEYEKPIAITLEYDYVDNINKEITIQHRG